MLCSAPSSVTVKSFAVRPSTGLPFLSFTFTVSTTSWLLMEKLAGLPLAGAFWPICWVRAETARNKRKTSVLRSIFLVPHDESDGHTAHGIGRGRKAELRTAERGVPTGEGDMVDGVGGIDPQVAAQPVTQPKRASSRAVQSELHRTRNGISSRVAKLAGKRGSISGGI